MAEPAKKKSKSVMDPFADGVDKWLVLASSINPSAGLVGGKSMRGTSATGILIDTDMKTYGENKQGSFYINKVTIVDHQVDIKHVVSKAETDYMSARFQRPMGELPPLTYKRGDTLFFTSFKPPARAIPAGSIVSISGLCFSYRPPSAKSKYEPEPVLSITGDIATMKESASFKALEKIIRDIELKPVEYYIEQADRTRPEFPIDSVTVNDMGEKVFDLSRIPPDTMRARSYQEEYAWVIVDNTLYHDGSVMNLYESHACPVVVVPSPAESDMPGSDKKNFLSKERKTGISADFVQAAVQTNEDAELIVPCIRQAVAGTKDYTLEGKSVGSETCVEVNIPLYESQRIYGVYTKELWPLCAGQLFRGTRAIVSIKLKVPDIAQHARLTDSFKLFGYPSFQVDYKALFDYSGYRISQADITTWLRKHYDSANIGSFVMTNQWKEAKGMKNAWETVFRDAAFMVSAAEIDAFKESINQMSIVCVSELKCDTSIQFGSNWIFYAVPLANSRSSETYERPTHEWVREENIVGKNREPECEKKNFEFINETYGKSKQEARKLAIFALNSTTV